MVLAIIGILLLVAMPSYGTMRDKQAVTAAAEVMQSALTAARMRALSTGEESYVTINFAADSVTSTLWDGTTYDVATGQVTGAEYLNPRVDWVDCNASGSVGSTTGFKTFKFRGRGTVGRAGVSNTYSIRVQSGTVTTAYYFVVNSITGKAERHAL